MRPNSNGFAQPGIGPDRGFRVLQHSDAIAELPAGAYSFQINAVDDDGNAILDGITYAVSGKVTGVEYGDGKTILQMGSVQVDLSKVKAVKETPAS